MINDCLSQFSLGLLFCFWIDAVKSIKIKANTTPLPKSEASFLENKRNRLTFTSLRNFYL